MESNNDVLKEKFKFRIAISKIKEEENIEKNKNFSGKKIAIAACACFVFTTGIVFAKEIKEFIFDKYRLGSESTINNGYIKEYDENNIENSVKYNATVTKKDNSREIMTNISIKNFLMADGRISIDYILEFDDKIKDYIEVVKTEEGNIDYEKFYIIELTEAYILDEENNLVYSPYMWNELDNEKEKFKDFCEENNLNFEYGNFNNKYFKSILNNNLEEFDEEKNILYMNLSIGNSSNIEFPKSKKLKMIIKEIKLIPKDIEIRGNLDEYITVNGNWILNIDLPEIMYNREDIEYRVVSTENKDFEVTSAKATESKFELDLIISNIEEAVIPKECARINDEVMDKNGGQMSYPSTKEGYIELYGSEELVKEYGEFLRKERPINFTGEQIVPWENSNNEGSYIINQENQKYDVIAGTLGNFCYSSDYDENGYTTSTFLNKYGAHINFAMTKYDATDVIEVIIDYKGSPTKIVLEKVQK